MTTATDFVKCSDCRKENSHSEKYFSDHNYATTFDSSASELTQSECTYTTCTNTLTTCEENSACEYNDNDSVFGFIHTVPLEAKRPINTDTVCSLPFFPNLARHASELSGNCFDRLRIPVSEQRASDSYSSSTNVVFSPIKQNVHPCTPLASPTKDFFKQSPSGNPMSPNPSAGSDGFLDSERVRVEACSRAINIALSRLPLFRSMARNRDASTPVSPTPAVSDPSPYHLGGDAKLILQRGLKQITTPIPVLDLTPRRKVSTDFESSPDLRESTRFVTGLTLLTPPRASPPQDPKAFSRCSSPSATAKSPTPLRRPRNAQEQDNHMPLKPRKRACSRQSSPCEQQLSSAPEDDFMDELVDDYAAASQLQLQKGERASLDFDLNLDSLDPDMLDFFEDDGSVSINW